MTHFLTLGDVQEICFVYAQKHLAFREPLPDFDTRFAGRLESILHTPQQQIGGGFVYKTLADQAAVLFYEMAKQHPFMNGNKRMACVALTTFLSLNEHWLEISWRELYDTALIVASSPTQNREGMRVLLRGIIEEHIKKSK